jgi:hypothetical protein
MISQMPNRISIEQHSNLKTSLPFSDLSNRAGTIFNAPDNATAAIKPEIKVPKPNDNP